MKETVMVALGANALLAYDRPKKDASLKICRPVPDFIEEAGKAILKDDLSVVKIPLWAHRDVLVTQKGVVASMRRAEKEG